MRMRHVLELEQRIYLVLHEKPQISAARTKFPKSPPAMVMARVSFTCPSPSLLFFPSLHRRAWDGFCVYPRRNLPCISAVRRMSSKGTPSPHPRSAYVHLPFCRRRCHYCDFPIVALGSSSQDSDERISNYISLLLREISAAAAATATATHPPLDTVFLGGGTPSLVPPRLVSAVLDSLRCAFGVSPGAEISIEMDPGTFDQPRLRHLLAAGVNRVSLGVQAFQDELLHNCGRAHGLPEVHQAVKIVSEEMQNWSLDLISSLPHQTVVMWRQSLDLAVAAAPAHVSVYDLQIEKGTKFGHLYTPGEFPLPSEDQSAEMYRIAAEILSREGYSHYEISSYAKPGFECRHNLTYWKNSPFYGFGLGAASHTGGARFTRPRRMKEYADYVAELEAGCAVPPPPEKDPAMDVVMLALRTARGLDMEELAAEFGGDLAAGIFHAVEDYVGSGHVAGLDSEMRLVPTGLFRRRVAAGEVKFLRLSDPEGFLLSNELISIIFAAIR